MALQHLRTSTAHKRPIPSVMSAGQLAINTNEASPGLFFKDSNGDLVKVGPVHIGTDAPNSSPASVAATALVTGTVYQILTVGTSDFTLVGASANTVGTVFTATGTTTGDGTVSGQQGVQKGEQWLDTTGGTYVLKIYDGTAWRSESGTFVDANGDTMTGPLILPSGTAAAPALGVGSTDNGLYSPGTDQVAVSTNGTGRLFIDSSGNVGIGETSMDALLVIKGNSDAATTPSIRLKDGTDTREAWITNASGDLSLNVGGDDNVAHGTLKIFDSGILDFAQGAGSRLRIDSSGRVGIKTTSMGSLYAGGDDLVIGDGGASNQGMTIYTGTSQQGIVAFADGTTGAAQQYAGYLLYDHSTDSFRVATTGQERLRIDSAGNVGIGGTATSSASTKTLQVTDSTTARMLLESTGTGGRKYGWYTSVDGQFAVYDYTANIERLRIDSAGNVAIGTSSPAAKTHISKSYSAPTGGHDSNLALIVSNSGSANNYAGIGIAAGNNAASFIHFGDPDDDNVGALNYFHDTNSLTFVTSASEQLRITSAGNIGIGNTAPSAKLQIEGTSDQLKLTYPSIASYIHEVHSNGDYSVSKDSSERLRIDSSGNVGIGTSNPTAKLHIIGNVSHEGDIVIRPENTGGEGGQITLYNPDRTSVGATIDVSSANAFRIFQLNNNSIMELGQLGGTGGLVKFVTEGSERLRINPNGNVGIGTSSPNNLLDVRGSSNPQLKVSATNTGTNSAGLYIENQGQRNWQIWADRSSDQLRIGHNSRASTVLTVTDTRVGVGTTSPQYPLDVAGNIRFGSSTGYSFIQYGLDSTATDNWHVGSEGDGSFRFYNGNLGAGSERMRITSGGNVGVGTTSPTNFGGNYQTIELAGTSGGVFRSTGGSHSADFYQDSSGTAILRTATVSDLVFSTNNTERMRIRSGGVININTTNNNPPANSVIGTAFREDGSINTATSGTKALSIGLNNSDGTLIEFRQAGTAEGSITVSGSTVSYNGGHLSRWSQLAGGADRTEILRGSVLSNLDEMCKWGEEDNEQLNRIKVSDVEGDVNVAGVFQAWDDDDDTYTNDFYCAMTGDFVIRIAQGTTVARGDLLMSAGDGTAKPQDDDIVRSKTIAKVTSTTVSTTYADGSYCVPCVLMAC